MPRSGGFTILALDCVLVFSYLLSANGTLVHSGSQAKTRKKAVTHNVSSVMGIAFNCIEQKRIDVRTNTGVESTATDPLNPYFVAPAVDPPPFDGTSRFAVSHSMHVRAEYHLLNLSNPYTSTNCHPAQNDGMSATTGCTPEAK